MKTRPPRYYFYNLIATHYKKRSYVAVPCTIYVTFKKYINSKIYASDPSASNGYLYAGLLCLSTLVGAFCNVHFNYGLAKLNIKVSQLNDSKKKKLRVFKIICLCSGI